jgi:methionyl-tRNA formyltransferase
MNRPLRVIFAGTPDFAAHHLQSILDDGQHEIVAVYTQPDRPAGRGKKLRPSPVKALAITHNIPVYQPLNFKAKQALDELQALKADLMVVVAYGLILPKIVLEAPALGCINVHASLLPRWRGAAPIQRAIEAGDLESGVTIMQMDEGLDTGDMLLKTHCPLADDETGGSLHDKLAQQGVPALLEALSLLASDQVKPQVQDSNTSTYAKKIEKPDLLIDWQLPAKDIERKIRAFNPFPVCFTYLSGERIKIWQAKTIAGNETAPISGTVTSVDKSGITVACGEGSLLLEQIQLPGKKAMGVADIVNGRPDLFTVNLLLGEQ